MRRLLFALLSVILCSASVLSQTDQSQTAHKSRALHKDSAPTITRESRQLFDYGKLPLSFEANSGQVDQRVKFLSRGNGYSLFLAGDEAVVVLKKSGYGETVAAKGVAGLAVNTSEDAAVNTIRMQLVGANANSRVVGADELPGKVNYLIGNNPSKWRTNISTYAKVKYEGVYPGVDLVYYGNQGQLEYDFVVSPGTPPDSIGLHFQANKKVTIDGNGDLILQVENVRFQKPRIYQQSGTGNKEIDGRYELMAANTVGFAVGDYDRSKPLIIDPVLVYSTYLGGSSIDQPGGIAVDAAENAYITGTAQSSDYPTLNAIQPIPRSAQDVFISKINAAGSALVYSTFLGGTNEDFGLSIAVDTAGHAYVTGQTYSTDFPVVNALEPTPATCCGPSLLGTGFVTKLNASGSALIYSSYLGGSGLDFGIAITADAAGNAYVTGKTTFDAFPVTPTAPQKHLGGKPGFTYNAFVTEINPDGSAFVFSTYLGGNGVLNPDHTVEFNAGDEGLGIAVDPEGNIYVTGSVESPDFPTTHALQSTLKGSSAAFVAKYKAGGAGLVYSTLLSGSAQDEAFGIAADISGNAYVTGETSSNDFPLVNPLQSVLPFLGTSFVTKINPSGSALIYSTYFGAGLDEVGGIVVDQLGNAYIAGSTGSTDFPVVNAFQPVFGGGEGDAFVAEINASGTAVVYASYLGGSGFDISGTGFTRGIAIDPLGNVYVTGSTDSTDFPTVNALQPHQTGFSISFVSKVGSTIDSRLNLSGQEFLTGHPCTIDSQPAACDAFTVGWSGGSGHSPNGWVPFPGDGNAAWEASVNYIGDVAFGKTVNLQGGTLALLLNPSKLLSEKLTEGKITWPSSATQDIGCGEGVATVHAWFTSPTGGSASFVGCLHDLPVGSVVPPKIWGTFFHVTGHE